MLEKIRRYVEKWHMIENGDKIIVGVSGGADSICLLFVLIQLQKEIPFELVCVHVNHGLRGIDADADEMYVKKMCEKHCVPCEIYREDVALIAKKRKQSLEEAGREVRREAFVKTLKRYGGTKIALAHHQNDNAETFLMNVARGAGLKGLGGIRPVNGNVIRPLLAVERGEVEKYLEEEGIAFCVDETNKSDAYMRNRIRNHILPYFEEQVNKRTVTHINETMERLREIEGFLEEQTEISWRQCTRTEETGTVILQAEFQQIPHVIQSFVLKKVLWEVCRREKDIEAVHLQMLQELFEKQVGRRVDLPYDMEAWRTYDGVVCRKKTEPGPQKAEENIAENSGQNGKKYPDNDVKPGKNAGFSTKNRQTMDKNRDGNESEINCNTPNISGLSNENLQQKENIRDIITTAAKEKEISAAAGSAVDGCGRRLWRDRV